MADNKILDGKVLDDKVLDEPNAVHLEEQKLSTPSSDERELIDVTPEEAKKIIWKIDKRLLIVLGLVYAIALLDRGTIGLARAAG